MEILKKSTLALRAGFVLPFALVMTFIVLIIVGAGAHYCTQTMRASDIYLLRSRARMAAQSTIENVKLAVGEICDEKSTQISEAGLENFEQTIANQVIDKVATSTNLTAFLERMRWNEAHRNDSDTTVTVGTKADSVSGVHRLYVTAEVRRGGTKASVTLEEDIKIPREDANIFHYAYFSNGDGHLIGLGAGTDQRLTVNGDVRANGDFYLSGVNVNGFIYAEKDIHLAEEADSRLKTWWNDRYVTIRTANSYNDNFRKPNTKHNIKTKYDVRVRPTDPIVKGGIAWEGGYREMHDYTKDPKRMSLLERLVNFVAKVIKAMTDRTRYDEGEILVTKDAWKQAKLETESEPKAEILNDHIAKLHMPRIVADSEPETESDKHLSNYREGYAATAKTPKGKTGGWLICSNSYMTASGPQQLSASLALTWKDMESVPVEKTRDVTVDEEVFVGEQLVPGEIITSGGRVYEALKPNSLAVRSYITADEYKAKVAANPLEKNNWCQLKGSRANDDGVIGPYEKGVAGAIPASMPHAGERLFFDTKSFEDLLRTNFNTTAEHVRAKFRENDWNMNVVASYTTEAHKKGEKAFRTDSISQYTYKDELSGIELLGLLAGTYAYAVGGYFTGADYYAAASEVDDIVDAYVGKGIERSDALSALLGAGWRDCNDGYYSRLSAAILDKRYVQLIQQYETGKKDTYRVVGGNDFKDWETAETIYHYSGIYYSKDPVGIIEINKGEYDEANITITFHSNRESTQTRTTQTYRKLIETKTVKLYNKSTNRRDSTLSGYANAKSGSPFDGKCFKSSDLNTHAVYFGRTYDAALESEIKTYFSGKNGGWSPYSSRYSSSVAGYLAIRLYGVVSDDQTIDFEVEYDYLSASDMGGKSDEDLSDDILDIYTIPVYTYYTSSGYNRTRLTGSDWWQISSSDDFNSKIINRGDDGVEEAAGYFDGKYGFTDDDVVKAINAYFNKTTYPRRTWTKRSAGYNSYRSSSPTGYLSVKVILKVEGSKATHQLECGYSSTEQKGYDLDVRSLTENEVTYIGTVPEGCIPVYDYVDDATYKAKSDWAKQFWQSDMGEDGCRSTKAHGFFKEEDLANAANAAAKANAKLKLKAEDVEAAVIDEEDAMGNTWTSVSNFKNHLSSQPKGYIEVKVDADHVVEVAYQYFAVSSGEIKGPDTIIPEHTEIHQVTKQETYIDYEDQEVEHNGETVVRELRGIFVREGYKIITDGTFTPPGWTKPLGVDSKDLKLCKSEPDLSTASTTADLRPFREDDQYHCNEKTDNGGYAADKGAVILIGTWDNPIIIDGPVVFESDVLIRGFVTGNGTIYSGRNIHIIGDIHYKNPPYWPYDNGAVPDTKGKDMLRLVSRGNIVIGNYVKNPATNKYVDEAWDKILNGHYIDGVVNSIDGLAHGVPYVRKNYTAYEQTGGASVYKIKYDYLQKKLDRELAKRYESVVGDYVFISRNDSGDADKPASGLSTAPYCDCRLAQTWDFNFGVTKNQSVNHLQYASYQSTVIQDYVNKNNWEVKDRVGTDSVPGRTFWDYLWRQHKNDLWSFARDNYYPSGSTLPRLTEIQHIDAVLYASQGLFGAVGGQKTPCVINGAVLANEEALLPFARMRRILFSSKTEGLSFTINWDIRLNRESEDSQRNNEYSPEIFKSPLWGKNESASEPGKPRMLHWMQVPDGFNKEYHSEE